MRKIGFHPFQLWLAGITLAVGLGVLATVPDLIQKDRFGQLSEMTSKNAVLGKLWLTSQISDWKTTLRAARKSHMANSDGSSPVDFKEFLGIVALTQSGVDQWQVAWSEKTSAFEFESSLGDPAFIQDLVAEFKSDTPEGAVGGGDKLAHASVKWIPGGSRAIALTILENPLVSADGTRKTQVALVGFLPPASMDAATRFFRGGAAELSVLDRGGTFLASNDRSRVGEVMTSSALSDRILRDQAARFDGVLSDETKEEFQVAAENVAGANLVVVARTPIAAVLRSVQNVKLTLVGFFGGLIFLMLLVGRAFIEGVKRKIHQVLEVVQEPAGERALKLKERLEKDHDWAKLLSLAPGTQSDAIEERGQSPTEAPGSATGGIGVTAAGVPETPSAKVELESLEQAGHYISQCLREPIAASIGHLKLAQGKTVEAEANQHLAHVEGEIRRIKELVEKVQRLGVYKALQTRPGDVSALLRDLLDDLSFMAETVGVKIRRSVYPVPKVRIATQDFREALKTLIQERVIASQSQGKTELIVGVEPSGAQVVMRIEDRCALMTESEQAAFFKPLSQRGAYDHQHQKMLAVLSYHDLKIRFENQGSEGNLILVELPAVEDVEISSSVASEGPTSLSIDLKRSETRAETAFAKEVDVWSLSELQTQIEGKSAASLEFLEPSTPDDEQNVEPTGRVLEFSEPVITGPLSEYSVKVRKPRLNVPPESKDL